MPIRSVLSRRRRRGLGTRVAVLRRDASRRRFRRSGAVATVVIAAASLAVVSPPATEPAAAQVVPLGATCSQLNAMVGRPTDAHIVGRGVRFVSDPGSDNSYTIGETISIVVELSLNVRFDVRTDLNPDAEPLSVDFMLGGNAPANLRKAVATSAKGEGTNRLTFEYTVQSGDTHQNTGDLWIPENSVRADDYARTFGGASDINTVGRGVPHQFIHGPCGGASLEHPTVFHPRSTGSPTIVSRPKIMSEPIDGDTYYAGEEIWVRIEYSEPVTVTGTPTLTLDVGGSNKEARFVCTGHRDTNCADSNNVPLSNDPPNNDPRRRSSMTRLLFAYTVTASDSTSTTDPDDIEGISVAWGSLSGGSITAMDNGVAATLYHDELEAQADLRAVDRDMDGEVDGGDPTVAKHLVDGSRGPLTSQELQDPSNPTFVSSYATRVVSEPATGTTLHEGEYVVVRADFNEAVFVDDTRLELPIQIFNCHNDDFKHRNQLSGTDLDTYDTGLVELGCLDNLQDRNRVSPTLKYAKYLSGSGHTRLLFYYRVTNDDKDRDGIIVPSGRFTYDGGKPIDESSQDIFRAADGGTLYTHYSDVFEKPLEYQRADGKAVEGPPTIQALEVTSMPLSGDSDPPDTYGFGETIKVKVTFNQAVRVTGTPKLTLNLQSGPTDAAYDSGDDSKLLIFHYAVEAGDLDGNGISIDMNSLKSNDNTNDTIVAADDGEDASLDHRQLGTQDGHKVDAMAPTITDLSISSDPPNGGTYYGVGSHIDIKVTYDDPVEITGNPSLEIDFGSSTQPDPRTADFNQQASNEDNNNRTIVFRYNVIAPDDDPDGIRVPAGSIAGTIQSTSQNPIPADRDFDEHELRTQPGHRVETIAPSVDAIAFVTSGSDCDASTLLVGEYICVAVTFDTDDDANDPNDDGDVPLTGSTRDRAIWVDTTNGTPSIELDVGGPPKDAIYHSGSGSGNLLVFRYQVESGLTDSDGVSIDAGDIELSGGVITDTAGNETLRQHDNADGPNVDSVVPEITGGPRISSDPPNSGPPDNNDTYGDGDEITFEVDFSEDVERSGTPLLRFQIGDDQVNPADNNRNAQYKESSAGCTEADTTNTCTLTFSYTVGSNDDVNDDDNDGISVDLDTGAGETTAISGTIKDRTGNPADLSHSALGDDRGHKVDAQPPSVSTVEITSTAPQLNNTYYKLGDIITVEVTFDDPIKVTLDDNDADLDDGPRIALRMRSGPEYADYIRLDGDNTMVFEHTVDNDDLDTDGIGIPSNAIQLRDATLADPQDNPAIITHIGLDDDPDNQKVDGVQPYITSGPTITSSPPNSGSPHNNDAYGEDSKIVVTVTFNEPVHITSASIPLSIGTDTPAALWVAPQGYDSEVGVETATFEYTVIGSDEDTDGISIVADTLSDDITDLVGNGPEVNAQSKLEHRGITNANGHEVETTAPTVSSVAITSPSPGGDQTYHLGDAIMVTVTFDEKVIVSGTPKITLDIASGDQNASYESGSGTSALVFTYRVVAADMDSDGVGITQNSLFLDSGTITDLPGNNAELDHTAVPDDANHKVNGSLQPRGPWVMQAPTITSSPDKLDTYSKGEHIVLEVMFSEDVTVSGRPYLPLVVGTETVEARYLSGSRTDKIRFQYTVGDTDAGPADVMDGDGVSVNAVSINKNGGNIVAETGGKEAVLTVPELTHQSAHQVDGVAPSVNSGSPRITSTPPPNSDDTYGKGDTIEVSIDFDEPVLVSGTPLVTLTIGTSPKQARLAGPSNIDPAVGATSLTFSYTVQPGDLDDNGVSIAANKLSGTITDLVDNPADRDHEGMPDNIGHKVDGGPRTTNPPGNGNNGGNDGGGGFSASDDGDSSDSGEGNPGIRVERIGGIDRFETAQLIAERYTREIARDKSLPVNERKITTVIIASGRAFPDALTASALTSTPLSSIVLSSPALAGSKNAPLLLTEPHELPEFTKEFLVEFEIAHVYIVGGAAAVSTDVEAAIAALPSVVSVIRFGGADRYETSVEIAAEVIATSGGAAQFCGSSLRTALLATGRDFADALALAPIAATGPHPLLLTHTDGLPDSVRAFFTAALADGSIEQIIVAGGPGAVSEDVVNELTNLGFTVVRVGGVDRYDTSVRMARFALRSGVNGAGTCLDNNRVALATGLVYADGLSGGPLIARLDGATILVKPNEVPHLVDNFLAWHRLDHTDLTLTVFGGPAAISYEVVGMARESAKRGLRR